MIPPVALIALGLLAIAWGAYVYDDEPGPATALLCGGTFLAVATVLQHPNLFH